MPDIRPLARSGPTARRIAIVAVAALITSVASSAQAQSAMSPVAGREQTADQQVHHALNRLAFGARPGDVERVRAMGVDAWIEQQLHPERITDTATEQWLTRFPTLTMSGSQFMAQYPPPGQLQRQLAMQQRGGGKVPGGTVPRGTVPGSSVAISPADSVRLRDARRATARASSELAVARTGRAVMSERQLQEVMVDFWANHFNVFAGKPQTRYYIAEYEREAIRPNALGSFRALLGAVAKSPAMLTYLDQWQSVADSGRQTLASVRQARAARMRAASANRPRGINENYARELMELHTLGVDGGYTQQDVMEVARALTGWTLSRGAGQGGSFVFRPDVHDAGAKRILGQTFPAGRGQDDGERVLDLLAAHASTAHFIATKLVRHFVSDEPPAALVDRATVVFTKTKGDIREVMRTIITSDEFFATDAYRAKVKTPFELVVSASRALGGLADPTPATAQLIARMGQPIYGRSTPDGYPDTADEWINTGAILNRMNFGLAVGANRLPGARLNQWETARTLRTEPAEVQVDGLVRALLGGDVSADTRAILLSGENPLLARAPTGSDSIFRADPDAETNDMKRMNGFPKLVGLAIGAPEFQRR